MYLGDDDVEQDNSNSNEDRPYTKQEIQTMLKTATDIRVKIIILVISSSGIRLGGIPLPLMEDITFFQLTLQKMIQSQRF
jgi:hypothetical protein